MKRCLVLAFALVLLVLPAPAPEARRFVRQAAPVEPSVIEHGFGGAPAFRLEMSPIRGDVHRMGGARTRLVDFSDYSRAGSLVVHREIAVGPLAAGPALVPPGSYAISLSVSGPEGLPVLSLASTDGLRLRIPMVSAPRPPKRPQSLSVVALAEGQGASVSLPLAIHLPTASGLILLGPVETLVESPLKRRRSRTMVIQEEMQRRALESGHVRSLERRRSREEKP